MNKFVGEAGQFTSAEAGLWLYVCCQEYPLYRERTTALIKTPMEYLDVLTGGRGSDETLVRTVQSIKKKLWETRNPSDGKESKNNHRLVGTTETVREGN